MSDSINHGDSLVSVFSMDRAAAQQIKAHGEEDGRVDFEKEELRQKCIYLEEQLATKDAEMAVKDAEIHKCYRMINGLRKLRGDGNVSELDVALARDRQKLMGELEVSSSTNNTMNQEDSFQPQIFANATADLVMNGSLMPSDIDSMRATFAGFRNVCSQMFKQLQGTASFLEKLIRSLENDEDEAAKKLLATIRGIQLNLNTSIQNASTMMGDAKAHEDSLSSALERSIRLSMAPATTANNIEVLVLREKIADMEGKYDESRHNVITLTTANNQLKDKLADLEVKYKESRHNFVTLTTTNKELQEKIVQVQTQYSEVTKKAEEKAKNLVPEILQEMVDIKSCLENVSEQSKQIKFQRKR